MPALFTTPGAIFLFARFRGDNVWNFLGTCETSPEVESDPVYLPVLNDLRGRSKPAQKIYDGSSDSVICLLNRYDQLVWKRCQNPFDHSAAVGSMGIDGRFEGGRLVMGIGDFELIIANDFFGLPGVNPDLRRGRLYRSVVVGQHREITAGGNRVAMVQVRFDCDGLFNSVTRNYEVFTEDLVGQVLNIN